MCQIVSDCVPEMSTKTLNIIQPEPGESPLLAAGRHGEELLLGGEKRPAV